MSRESAVRIGLIYPELMGTYGDRGNVVVLERRLAWRGIPAEVVTIAAGQPVPAGLDCLVLGGAEDVPQTLAAAGLMASAASIAATLDGGGVLLAVCAGFQLLGQTYVRTDGKTVDGLGLVAADTVAGSVRRIGEVVVEPGPALSNLGLLTGFENHAGITTLGPGVSPLGRVRAGSGNGDGRDGALAPGRIVATYLHGPVLARNSTLADLLLTWVAGPLEPLDDDLALRLHAERLHAATGARKGWLQHLRSSLRGTRGHP